VPSGKKESTISFILSESTIGKEAPVGVLFSRKLSASLAEYSKAKDELTTEMLATWS
jgi:hypothetical protein